MIGKYVSLLKKTITGFAENKFDFVELSSINKSGTYGIGFATILYYQHLSISDCNALQELEYDYLFFTNQSNIYDRRFFITRGKY